MLKNRKAFIKCDCGHVFKLPIDCLHGAIYFNCPQCKELKKATNIVLDKKDNNYEHNKRGHR